MGLASIIDIFFFEQEGVFSFSPDICADKREERMPIRIRKILTRMVLCLLLMGGGTGLAGCARDKGTRTDPKASVYYWRTALRFSPVERKFLKEHDIRRMYVRYFDVVPGEGKKPVPNATLMFDEAVPQGVEVIPTVFIVEEVLRQDTRNLAEQIVRRILQMNETHDVKDVREVQLDCDWTARSREACYALFARVRSLLQEKGMSLSATIRLHQLRMPPPPVDYGALMLYNTGNALKAEGRNPILDFRDVEPYLPLVAVYDLPLVAAYPDFRWRRLFGKEGFKGVLYGRETEDTLLFRRRNAHSFYAVASRTLVTAVAGGRHEELHIVPGDSVLESRSEWSEIQSVQRALGERRPSLHEQVILYPIAEENIHERNFTEYEKIFHP